MENFDAKVYKKLRSSCFNGEWQAAVQYGILWAQSTIYIYENTTLMLDRPSE